MSNLIESLPARLVEARLRESPDARNLEAMVLANKLGILQAKVEFSGSNDSGDTYDATLFRKRRDDDAKVPWRGDEQEELIIMSDRKMVYVTDERGNMSGHTEPNEEWTDAHKRLTALVDEIAGDKIDACGVDWYNNEGGGGHVSIDFVTGAAEVYVYQNETRVCNEETAEFNLLDGEEE